jgi:hypothetical protein
VPVVAAPVVDPVEPVVTGDAALTDEEDGELYAWLGEAPVAPDEASEDAL